MKYRASIVKHGSDFIVEGLVIQIFDFDGLEIFLRIEIALGNEESLAEDKFFDFGIIIVHDIIIDITFLVFVNFQKFGNLLS